MSDPDFLPPPPAYEDSQQEFDRKVDTALIASANNNSEEEEWQTWDDALFEAAAQTHDGGGPSRGQDISPPRKEGNPTFKSVFRPLSINKGSKGVAPAKPKERPSWLAEAGLEDPSSSSTRLQADYSSGSSSSSAAGGSGGSGTLHPVYELSPEELEDDEQTICPPPFTAVDHAPFQEVPHIPAYHGNDSNPPSPLSSPLSSPIQINAPPHHLPQVQAAVPSESFPSNRQSLPSLPRNPLPQRTPRPVTTTFDEPAPNPVEVSQLPHMPFDPSMAYHRPRRMESSLAQPIQQFQSPYTSLYNSVVIPHLTAKPPMATSDRSYSSSPSNYQVPHNPLNPQQLTPQLGRNVADAQAYPSSRHLLTQPQYHSYPPSPSPQSTFSSAPMSHHLSDPRLGPNNGSTQGRWASSEQQILWDVYQR